MVGGGGRLVSGVACAGLDALLYSSCRRAAPRARRVSYALYSRGTGHSWLPSPRPYASAVRHRSASTAAPSATDGGGRGCSGGSSSSGGRHPRLCCRCLLPRHPLACGPCQPGCPATRRQYFTAAACAATGSVQVRGPHAVTCAQHAIAPDRIPAVGGGGRDARGVCGHPRDVLRRDRGGGRGERQRQQRLRAAGHSHGGTCGGRYGGPRAGYALGGGGGGGV